MVDRSEEFRAVPSTTDVLIVGGGPAGLAAAIALRQKGIACVVVEAQGRGTEKACGEGLMPDALAALKALGVSITADDGHVFRGIRFANATHQVAASFDAGVGIGVRRPHLHKRLADRASALGATLLWNSRIALPDDPQAGTALVQGKPLGFRWLIGADGRASQVRRWAGLDRRSHAQRLGFRAHYQVAPWSEEVEIHWGPAGQLYLTPVAPDCVCAVFLGRGSQRDMEQALAEFPEVAARLAGAPLLSRQRGAVSATNRLHRVAATTVALVGDASGSADAITGEGLAMSFRQALALADSIKTGSLAPYRREHQRIGRMPHRMGALMLTLDRWPWLERRALGAFAATPELFAGLLALHTGNTGKFVRSLRHLPGFSLRLMLPGTAPGAEAPAQSGTCPA